MINAERYRNEILNIINDDYSLAVNKNNPNGVSKCGSFPCADCMFSKKENGKARCTRNKMHWLLSEYKEPVKVSSLEHELLKFWYESGCCYRYIARDLSGNLFLYVRRPTKKAEVWASIEWHKFISDFNDLFKFVKWEDEEPTSIKDVLENYEVIKDESK